MSIILKKNSLFVKDGGQYKDIAVYSAPQTVEKWLDNHPEVTTSIQDGEVTFNKLNSTVQNRISSTESNVSTLQNSLSSEASARSAADTNLNNQISALRGAVGSPLVAATAVAMTDTDKIYVYTGDQSGYTNGNWYYYSGNAWVSGGVYNSIAIETDNTPVQGSVNPVMSGGVYSTIQNISDPLPTIGEQVNVLYYNYWEHGSLDNNNNTIVASSYHQQYRARTPITHPIHLSKGDTIITKNDFQFNVLYMDNDTAISVGWKTYWTVSKDIDAFIIIKPVTESGDEIPVKILSNSIFIIFANGAVTKIQNSLCHVLSAATRNADAVDSPTYRASWADYAFSESNYVVRISGTLDTSENTRVLLMKAHTLNTADIIKEVYIGAVSDGTALYFSVTAEEASQITCIAVSQYTALAVNYKVELFNADQYYWKIEKLTDDIDEIVADLALKQDALTFDTTPTEGSTNPVTSGGVAAKLTTLDDGLINIGKQVNKTYYPYWERGGLDRYNNVIDVSNYNKIYRARTPIDHPIHLSKGDTIQTEDGFMFFCLYMDEGVAQSSTAVKRWTVPKDIDAYITVRPSTESGDEIPVETLANSISITYASGELTKVQDTLYLVLTSTTRTADATDSPTYKASWADYSFVPGSYVLKLSGTLDTNANTRILLMKAHTLNIADTIKTIYFGVVSNGAAFYFDITEEEAAEVTCVCVAQYTALAISYTVELFGADQYYWKIEKLSNDVNELSNDVNELSNDVNELSNDVSELMLNGMPDYYTDHIAKKVQEVNANTRFINGISFPFITDLHFSANSKNSKYLLKDILDNTACDFVIGGGDYGVTGASAEISRSCISNLLEYASIIGHEKWFPVNGNHDFTGSEPLTWGETYNAIFRPSERWTVDGQIGGYFCIDNDVQKTRIICLNSCMPPSKASSAVMDGLVRVGYDQYQYLISKINEVSEYKIIVISHIPSDSALKGYVSNMAELQTVLELLANKEVGTITASGRTLNVDFTATTNTLICHINGHSHADESHVSNGVLSISTTCDAHYQDDGHGAVAGTVTEQAFDVFCIDYDAETITTIRVGRGGNRKWSFDGSVLT